MPQGRESRNARKSTQQEEPEVSGETPNPAGGTPALPFRSKMAGLLA
jgi:hypothetical protein